MPTSQGTLKPFVNLNRSTQLYNSVGYPVGGNVSSTASANFKASFASGSRVIYVTYITSGVIIPGMSLSGISIPIGATIVGPLNQNGTGTGGLGSYTISMVTLSSQGAVDSSGNVNLTGLPGSAPNVLPVVLPSGQYGLLSTAGTTISGQSTQLSSPQGPGGVVGPIPGFNCVNIQDLRDYYNLPYPPATPLASPPVIAIVSFGGGIYGQPVTTGQYAGFWKCTDISGNNGAPIQILVSPINGAINAPNADDGGSTLENTVDVATVNAFYGMIDPRRDAPIYTPPVIILYIAPSGDISEMYRTFYTVLKNPVICNGKSYSPSVVMCSWGAPEVAWTQKMAFPPNPSIPVDNDPNPSGIAELNEINDLFAEATKNGINVCCASGDIPLTTVNSSINTFNYAQSLLLQGLGGAGNSGQIAVPQSTVFPLTNEERASLPAPQVNFPASSPYVTCVGGSAVYFPSIATGSYANAAEFAWARGNGGISSVFSIPAYQQQLPGAAATSAAQFLAASLNTANLAETALGTPAPVFNSVSGGYTAPNTAVTLATQAKEDAYTSTLAAFEAANYALQSAQLSDTNDALVNSLVEAVKSASTALATAEANKKLALAAEAAAEDLVVKTQSVSYLLTKAGNVFGAAAASTGSVVSTQNALLSAKMAAQVAAYNQLIGPSTANTIILQNANQALQAAQAVATSSELAAVTLPSAVTDVTDVANEAVEQAASAVIAPSLSSHPYVAGLPVPSPLPPTSIKSLTSAEIVAGDLPYDESQTFAPSYLLTSLGLGYTTDYANSSGNNASNIRAHIQDAVTNADILVAHLVNYAKNRVTGDTSTTGVVSQSGCVGEVASLTDLAIEGVIGQLDASGSYAIAAQDLIARVTAVSSYNEMLPEKATGYTAPEFATRAKALAQSSSALISSYRSGAGNANLDGYKLPTGLASAAASALAAVWGVTGEELNAEKVANFPYGTTDTKGGVDASGTYGGITTGLINLRNIYANTTLAARRAETAQKAAHAAKDAFVAWSQANELVEEVQAQATTLYNLVPGPSNDQVRVMDAKLTKAKVALSATTYDLGVADNYAVTTARLAQQSMAATSAFMGNYLDASGSGATYDQLGNLNAIPSTNSGTGAPVTVAVQGANNANCPAIAVIDASGSILAKNALVAAQSLILAATNDNYLTTSVTTWNTHGVTGVDTSGNQTVSLTGTRLLVQDAQYAAAGAAGQVANVAFADATESVARFSDWFNVANAAVAANTARAAVYTALTDASGNSGSAPTNLNTAVNAITATLTLLIAATTPYNQQATTSASIATNDVVVLSARLENARAVCAAAQTAIQLAASTYNSSSSSNISGIAGGGGSIFTINMAYAKVTAEAAQAACTAAAIVAREEAVVASRRANYSAIALRKLVGDGIIGEAIAGFLDASGNLVTQTGYDATHALPYSNAGSNIGVVNGTKPPAVVAPTVLYQGCGGLSFNSDAMGMLQSDVSGNPGGNNQPSIITNLTYTSSAYANVYSAVAGLSTAAQAVITALQADSSGNATELASPNQYLTYPNVNAVNALSIAIGATAGAGRTAVNACLLAAYEAQQWVVASVNASFVTFGYSPANVNLVNFTPSLMGVANKLAQDADACLETVLNAEGAILYALSQRPSRVALHDIDAANFAATFNSNQAAADTYLALQNSAIKHEQDTLKAFHMADMANALSPLVATAATAAGQAAALGAMTWSSPTTNPNITSNSALANANFPAGGWGSDSTNPNFGPFNGTGTGAAPYPAPWSSNSSRIQSPSATVLDASHQILSAKLSEVALEASRSASNALDASLAFNKLMVDVSTITPALVDAATSAAQKTLRAAQAANYATTLNNQGMSGSDQTNFVANLVIKSSSAILAAAESARANLEAIAVDDERYASRQNMLRLWNIAVDAAKEVVAASANAPLNYQYTTVTAPNGSTVILLDPNTIVPQSLGNLAIMGTVTTNYNTRGNIAPYYVPVSTDSVLYTPDGLSDVTTAASPLRLSLLAQLNVAVRDAYNATTGAPSNGITVSPSLNGTSLVGAYQLTSINWPVSSGTWVANVPENVNDTEQAYNTAVYALSATAQIGNAPKSAVLAAGLAIKAAFDAAVAVDAANMLDGNGNPLIPTLDASGNAFSLTSAQGIAWLAATTTETTTTVEGGFGANVHSAAAGFWFSALSYVNSLIDGSAPLNQVNLSKLMAIVGINFNTVTPADNSALAISNAAQANNKQRDIMNWAQSMFASRSSNTSAVYASQWTQVGSAPVTGIRWPGYVNPDGTQVTLPPALQAGQAYDYFVNSSNIRIPTSLDTTHNTSGSPNWSAYYFTVAIMGSGNVAFETARKAWNAVLNAYNTVVQGVNSLNNLDYMSASASELKTDAVYSVKLALQSAARAGAAGEVSAKASAALASSSDSYEDLAAEATAEASYASTANLNMYRCVPDIAMHADADDLPVIFRLNGGNVYVGGTSVAAAMFAGFLGVAQSHSPINYFVNPVLYDNYTFPSPIFNDISGSLEVWYSGASTGVSTPPPRIANILPGVQNPASGLGSGLYNLNVGLGSIKGMNLSALMEVPHLVTSVSPDNGDSSAVTVYPGTSATVTAYVEPVTAYNPHLVWSCSSSNAIVSQTDGPLLSNNGINDTQPYTPYNPLIRDTSGNQRLISSTIGNYHLGSVGNVSLGTNPFNNNAPCLVFTATVTGVTAVSPSAPLPVVRVSSTDGSSVYGQYSVVVLPAIQVSGVSISALNERSNPSNTTLFLGTTLQLLANVTPLAATNKRVYWWSSNTAIVNVDASGLLTSLAPGQVTIKATSVNNNISASISVYVPTPITGINVLPTTITLNPNMRATPLKNLGLIRAIIQPAEADYKHLTWEIVSSQQSDPAPIGISDVISLPLNGTVIARDSSGDITDNTEATVTALSNGTAVIKVSTYGEPYGVYGTYTSMVTVNVVTPLTDVVMEQTDMIINLNPHTAQYDGPRSLPESYQVTATLKPAYPSNMSVFWSSSNPKVAVVSNNTPAVLNTTVSDPNFGLWQITETITPLSNGTTVIKVTTADGSKTAVTTVVVTTPVTGLSMSAMPIILNPSRVYTLQATVLPTTATNRALIWESTNTAIATVDSNGVVKAVTSGSCGIMATTVDGEFSATSQLSVVTPLVGVQLMVNTPLPIHINDVVQILVVMVPITASNQQFTWTVTDGVDGNIFTTGPPQNGNIVYLDAVQAGNSVFTVTTADGNKQASINLQVVQW